MKYQPLLISFEQAAELRTHLGQDGLIGHSIAAEIDLLEQYMKVGVEVPGHGEAGGEEHNRHKQNYIYLDMAARLYLITEEAKYLEHAKSMLLAYALVYPTLGLNISRDTNPPGRLFHQTLNENMWMLYASCAYSCIRHTLTQSERDQIEDNLFKLMIEMFVETYAHDFDIVHNHGVWAVAGVGMCGYAIDDQASVDKALYGLKGDRISGGFLAQLSQLFSPDGYYMEGPYYHRFAIRPIFLFAEAIARRQPELDIYNFNNQVIKTTTYALMATAFPNGVLPALNDSSRTMNIDDEGLLIATSLSYQHYQQDNNLMAMARHQQKVWVHASGAALSAGVDTFGSANKFSWGSVFLNDGAAGDRGGVAILRHRNASDDETMALLWFGQHGSDHKFHSALDHGHFDGLHLSLFNQNQEVLHDYGFSRFVNIESKFGGRYLPENKSYSKQTLAHNTVVVDQRSQNDGDTSTAEARWGNKHFFLAGDNKLQAMSATISNYYPGVDQQRTVLVVEVDGIANPLLIDLFKSTSDEPHQYDYLLHYGGQILRTDFDYQSESVLKPLGDGFGYQHVWRLASGSANESSLVSWLMGHSYYSLISSSSGENSEVIFARTGANDPHFNLRNEPMLVLRQHGADHLFANVLETHGYYDEASETSVGARGEVVAVRVIGFNSVGSVIEIELGNGRCLTVMVSNRKDATSQLAQEVCFDNKKYQWCGPVKVTG
ncbi:MAG: chondroitin lyase [Gammaproteobacteria bacterium]|nr:chondroitin lyase [Gammaproteobacteria bacterium]